MEFRFKLQLDLGFIVLLISFISWIPVLSQPSLNPMHFGGNYTSCPLARGGGRLCVYQHQAPLGERLGPSRTSRLGSVSLASLASPRFIDPWRSPQPSRDCQPGPSVFFFSYLSDTGPRSQEDFAASIPSFLSSEAAGRRKPVRWRRLHFCRRKSESRCGMAEGEAELAAWLLLHKPQRLSPSGADPDLNFQSNSAAPTQPQPRHALRRRFLVLGSRRPGCPPAALPDHPPSGSARPGLARGSLAPGLLIRTRGSSEPPT